jgi:hypothetical protein
MRYFYFLALGLLLSACNPQPNLELSFKADGIKTGTITLSQFNETLFSQNIKEGSATISKPLATPGYYTISVIDGDQPLSTKQTFELYLENGNYTVEAKPNESYPAVTTASKLQLQLNDYYKVEDEMAGTLNHTVDSLLKFLDSRDGKAQAKRSTRHLLLKHAATKYSEGN